MTENKSGLGIGTVLCLIFLTLKLAGVGVVATWSWVWIFSPLWIPVSLLVALLGIAVLVKKFTKR
jgi:predicted membrane channel-forming protein YqfA (hemolysin III family)